MRKGKIIVALILVIIGVAGYFIYQNISNKALLIERVEVETVTVRETVSSSGEMVSEYSADLRFSSSGIISRISVEDGQEVSSNQLLAQLNSYSVSQSAQAAKDARDIAIRNKDLFIQQYSGDKDAVGGETEYEIRLRTLNEEISRAEAGYRSQLGNLTDLNIRAPFSGTVIDVLKKQGEPATAAETIIKLADLSKLYFEMEIDQEDFGKINIGDMTEIELDAYPDYIFTGEVIGLPTYVDSISGSQLKVKIRLNNDENKPILLGMAGDGTIIVNQSTSQTKALTFDAVFTDEENRSYIWIVENNILKKKYINIGTVGDVYTEVLDNLEGLTIVIPSDAKTELIEGEEGQILN